MVSSKVNSRGGSWGLGSEGDYIISSTDSLGSSLGTSVSARCNPGALRGFALVLGVSLGETCDEFHDPGWVGGKVCEGGSVSGTGSVDWLRWGGGGGHLFSSQSRGLLVSLGLMHRM